MDDDTSINEAAPSIDEVKEAVAKLRDGKAASICNISAELIKTGGEAMIANLLLMRVRSYLLKYQSGFTTGKSQLTVS